jgi:hypothetical protein
MFTPKRTKAVASGRETSTGSNAKRIFRKLAQSVTLLADSEQWLTGRTPERDRSNDVSLADEQEHILRCLGAAVILQWNTLPTKLRRELFDNAGSMGELLETAPLRGQIARFLHKHKNDERYSGSIPRTEDSQDDASSHAAEIARWDDEGGASRASATSDTKRSKISAPRTDNR